MIKYLSLALIFSALLVIAPATAQESVSLLPRNYYKLELFNAPHISETQFTLRLSAAGAVTGCAQMGESTLETSYVFDTLKLEISDAQLTLNDDARRYSSHDCPISNQSAFIDVSLDRDMLIRKKIKKIKLTSALYGEFMTSEIAVNKQKVEIKTKTPSGGNMETLWFLPSHAVTLFAPQAPSHGDPRDMLRKFGRAQGLVPMQEIYQGFMLPKAEKQHYGFCKPIAPYLSQPS